MNIKSFLITFMVLCFAAVTSAQRGTIDNVNAEEEANALRGRGGRGGNDDNDGDGDSDGNSDIVKQVPVIVGAGIGCIVIVGLVATLVRRRRAARRTLSPRVVLTPPPQYPSAAEQGYSSATDHDYSSAAEPPKYSEPTAPAYEDAVRLTPMGLVSQPGDSDVVAIAVPAQNVEPKAHAVESPDEGDATQPDNKV